MKLVLSIILATTFASNAWALLPAPEKKGIGLAAAIRDTDDYRLGSEWGKKPVTPEELNRASPSFRRAAFATAHVGGATGFYLGKFHGHHVMATNHHVMPSDSCSIRIARFPLLNVAAKCEKFLGTWDEVDLTLFTIKLSPAEEAKLAPVAGNFRLHDDVLPGQNLVTIGFGIAGNGSGKLMANQDGDCYVFSQKGDYRLMADPDQFNPGAYRAWSFALGCDVSHGDSGSAIVDRETSNVVGIIWTGRIPKSKEVQSSAHLTKMFKENQESIWQELSYAVPAKKIGELLTRLTEGSLPEETRSIFQEMLR